jgi:hypothetical protein
MQQQKVQESALRLGVADANTLRRCTLFAGAAAALRSSRCPASNVSQVTEIGIRIDII